MDSDGIAQLLNQTAAEVIAPRFRQLTDGDIAHKKPGDLVTVADREAEAHLAGLLRGAHPEAVVVGEEAVFADARLLDGLATAEHAFVIDPIDGTRNFVAGRDEFGIMLAELRSGVTTRGWILQPRTGRCYVAERGAGTRLNGLPIERTAPQRAPLGATSRRAMHGFTADGRLSPVVESDWCCAFDYPKVLHGEIDFLVYTTVHPWDHLAGSLMVTEAGGVSRTLDGTEYNIASRASGLLVAADPATWLAVQESWPWQ